MPLHHRLLPLGLAVAVIFAPLAVATQTMSTPPPPGPGLGSNTPTGHNLSLSARFHVYRWVQGPVTFLQVSDLDGTPLMAVATDGTNFLRLPIGSQAQRVQTPDLQLAPASVEQAMRSETVYKDSQIIVRLLEHSSTAAATEGPIWHNNGVMAPNSMSNVQMANDGGPIWDNNSVAN